MRAAPKGQACPEITPSWRASLFHDHTLLATAELSDFKPYEGVSERSVIERVLHLSGIGDSSEARFAIQQGIVQIGLVGRDGDDGVVLTLSGVNKAKDLVFDGLPRLTEPVVPRRRHRMAVVDLTDDPNVNLTAKWIEKQGQPLIDKLIVWLGSKMRRSEELGQIEDHVQQFLLNMVKRDSLRTALLTGESISLAKIKGYVYNQGKTDTRNNGRNAVCRAIHGALTPKEVKARKTLVEPTVRVPRSAKAHENPNFTWVRDAAPMDGNSSVPMENIQDVASITQTEQKLAFDAGFKAVQDILRRRAPKNAEQYGEVLYNRIVLEMSVREISEHMGITRNEAASRLRTAKNIISREREAGRSRLEDAFDR